MNYDFVCLFYFLDPLEFHGIEPWKNATGQDIRNQMRIHG